MTALKKYQKLESTGLWRDAPEDQRREVLVNFGEASLMLSDPRTEIAFSHWSLPAVERLNPGELPALYSPGADATETLEIEDRDMIAALETVHDALEQARPHPGRLRSNLLGGGVLVVLALAVFWMPGSMIRQTAAALPASTRSEIGRIALGDLSRVTGAVCSGPMGNQALLALSTRLFGANGPQIVVLRDGGVKSLHLPGHIIALHRSLFETQDGPEAAAGFAITEAARAGANDPLIPLLRHAGLRATFGLLTTGAISPDSISGYAETLLRSVPDVVADDALLAQFKAAGVPSAPYAYAVDPSGETVLPLIEADPFSGKSPAPILADGDWIGLQNICSE